MATETASKILPAGAAAPDFSLHSTPDQLVSLSDFRGVAEARRETSCLTLGAGGAE